MLNGRTDQRVTETQLAQFPLEFDEDRLPGGTEVVMKRSPAKLMLVVSMLVVAWTASASGIRAQPTPSADVTITGETANDDFGWEVAPAGDVNGDGVPDLIVGAPSNDAVAGFAGRAYLFLGPVAGALHAANADAIISAEAFGDNLGFSVASAGDVNGDGARRHHHRRAKQRYTRDPGGTGVSVPRARRRRFRCDGRRRDHFRQRV